MSVVNTTARKITSRTKSLLHRAIEKLEDRRLMSATITLVNPDVLPGSDRLIFNYVQNPNTTVPNVVHDTQTLQITDTGTTPLVISNIKISGPWAFVSPPAGGYTNKTVNPGTPLVVTLAFTQRGLPAHAVNQTDAVSNFNGGAVINGSLTITSNAANAPTQAVALAGYWQSQSENNSEPNLTTITNLLAGYTTNISNPYSLSLDNNGTTTYYGQEVVASSWIASNSAKPVTIQELSSFHIQGSTDTTYWYSAATQASHLLLTSVPNQGQTLLPTLANGNLMSASFTPGGTFGFRVDNEFSNDAINTANGDTAGASHHFRFYPLIDEHGNAVANSWIVAEDAGAFNYQDNVFVVSNMQPVTTPSAPTNFTATNALNPVLTWDAENYPTLAGYNVYRATSATGTFTKLTATPITGTTFTDNASPPVGTTLYYRLTAVDSLTKNESAPATTTANTFTGPLVQARSVSAFAGTAIDINLLAGDTDTGGTILPSTFAISTATNHGGTVSIDPTTGVATYTSTANFAGTETFSYTVSDTNNVTSAPAVVTISVTNQTVVLPTASPVSGSTLINNGPAIIATKVFDSTGAIITPASVLLAATPGGTPAASITTANGTATVDLSGVITYTPNANLVGSETFYYQATDSHGNVSNIAAVGVNVGVMISTQSRTTTRAVLYKDQTGTNATVTLSRGFAGVYFDGTGTVGTPRRNRVTVTGSSLSIHNIILGGTSAASTLSITSNARGNVTLGGITDNAPLGSISAKTSNLAPDTGVAPSGIITLDGVKSMSFKSITQGQIAISAGNGAHPSLSVSGTVNTSTLSSDEPITTLNVGAWTNTSFTSSNTPSSINAPAISTLVSRGEFDANLTLPGVFTVNPPFGGKAPKPAPVLGSARLKGPVNGGAWAITGDVRSASLTTVTTGWAGATISGNLNSMSVHSALASDITAGSINSLKISGILSGNITTTGNLNSLQAGQLVGSVVNVGTTATSVADATLLNIGTATLKNLRLTGRAANTFSDSSVIAENIGSITTGKVNTNSTTQEGITAHSIKSATVGLASSTLHLKAADLLSNTAIASFLTQKGASLGTFAIDIL